VEQPGSSVLRYYERFDFLCRTTTAACPHSNMTGSPAFHFPLWRRASGFQRGMVDAAFWVAHPEAIKSLQQQQSDWEA